MEWSGNLPAFTGASCTEPSLEESRWTTVRPCDGCRHRPCGSPREPIAPCPRRKLDSLKRRCRCLYRGEGLLNWRHFVCLVLIAILPVSLSAEDTGAAILHSSGSVLLNKNPAPSTSALLATDVVETQKEAVARIESTGSLADLHPETLLQFAGDLLILEHGGVSVNTSRGMKVQVGCVTVTPVGMEWTHYEVSDVDGRIAISALKNDVYVESHSATAQPAKGAPPARTLVREGQQISRDEKCGATPKQSAPAGARGGILNSPYVIGPATGVIVGVGCWALCRGDEPISPDHP